MKRAAAGLAGVGFAIAACQAVVGIDRVEKVAASADAAVPDAENPDPCAHVTYPPPPLANDEGEDLPPIVFAVNDLRLTAPSGEPVPGFDLDRSCACDGRPGVRNVPSCTAKDTICDGDAGIDNFGDAIFRQFDVGANSLDGDVRRDITEGIRGLLVQVAEWNGTPNDTEVKIGVTASVGLSDPSGCGSTTTSDGEHYPPGWCGKDRWDYPPGTLVTVQGVLYPAVRGSGYVTNGQLVYRERRGGIQVFFGFATITFGSSTTFGKLERLDDGRFRLGGGLLAGRIPIEDLLSTAGQFSLKVGDSGTRVPLCTSPFYDDLRRSLCDSVDIMRSEVNDFTDRSCDAVSAAIGFTAEQAVYGSEKARPSSGDTCSPTRPENGEKYRCP